ncbi:Mismatch repair protein msh3 [Coemansia sp. RSA 1933]|nr:Mismatch repair protein msh3 [Coemansia sp. RSA 1933]
MSSSKRVQVSLSSFFKPKQEKQRVAATTTPANDISLSQSSTTDHDDNSGDTSMLARTHSSPSDVRLENSTKRRRVISSDKDDEEYIDNRAGSASHTQQSETPKRDKGAFPFPKRRSTTGHQDTGRTMVKSVSDTTNMMQRLRMRIAGAKESEEGKQTVLPVSTPTGSLDQTSIQLVERKKGTKYTPLEVQVLEAKEQHPDMLLAVEVGYKYRFFGEDARIASRVLGIMCTTANNFYNASIPAPRLMIHVRRLVRAGYKVGVVRQVETAALKAIGDNKSAPFSRKLAEVYTSGTLVEEIGDSPYTEHGSEKYLMCITEGPIENKDKRVNIGLLAVQLTSGDIVYDFFEDGYLRSALETRLAHLQPGEIIIPPSLSTETRRTLSGYVGYTIRYDGPREPLLEYADRTGVRVAFADPSLADPSAASSAIVDFYTKNNAINIVSYALGLPTLVSTALAMTLNYLTTFNLTHVFLVRRDSSNKGTMSKELFAPFHSRIHMLLSATTLQTLNIFTVSSRTGDSEHSAIALKDFLRPSGRVAGIHSSHVKDGDGSLFSIMDFTRSQFGRRMLRRWTAHPLTSLDRLMDRIESVEYLKGVMEDVEVGNDTGGNDLSSFEQKRVLTGMHNKIGQMVDIERGLCRIHYGQATTQELLRILRSLEAAVSLVPADFAISEPRLLAETLDSNTWSQELRDAVLSWTNQIDYQSAKRGNKDALFSRGPLHDLLQERHLAVEQVDSELASSIEYVRSALKDECIEFKSISGIDYLIDVKNTKVKMVPLDWVKVSGTKTNSRFHTPYIISKLAERERSREALQQTARNVYKSFLAEISGKYAELRELTRSLATLDALFSLAILARRDGYCKPEFVDAAECNSALVELVDAVNPVLGYSNTTYVPNTVSLGGTGSDAPRAMILTGPNAGGKSSLIRTVALTSIMAQCGSYVPASRARLGIIDAIFTRIGASDNMMAGESTFMVEMRETQELMRQVTPRSLAILDELGRGTSTHDGAAIAYAVLDYLVRKRALTFFVTHYAHLVGSFAANEAVRSCHMSYLERSQASADDDPAGARTGSKAACRDVTFLYKLVEGASEDSFGLNVARMAGLPEPLLLRAKERASWMHAEMESKRASKHASELRGAVARALRKQAD